MLLAIRIIAVILFSAFVAWSQTPDAGPSWQMPVLKFPKEARVSEANTQYTFKLDIPERYLEREKVDFVLASSFPAYPRPLAASSAVPVPPQKAFGYMTRHKIHKYASIATLPLVVSEIIVGEKLDDDAGDSLSSTHSALAAGIGVLFGVESVTGVWNLWTTRKSPGHGKRLFHGVLMLAADAGFVATAALAPDDDVDSRGIRTDSSSAHRVAAYSSLGIAAVSYIYMLFAK